VWRTAISDVGPTSVVVHRGRLVFGSESCHVHVVAARTGEVLWERYLGDPITAAPAVAGDRVFAVYAGSSGWALASLDLDSGEPRWRRRLRENVIDAPVVAEGAVFVTTVEGTVRVFDAATGRPQWTARTDGIGAPSVADGEVRVVAWPRRPNGKRWHLELSLAGLEPGHDATFELLEQRLSDMGQCTWDRPLTLPVHVRADGRVAVDTSGVEPADPRTAPPDERTADGSVRACLDAVFQGMRVPPIGEEVTHRLSLSRGSQHVVRLDAATGARRGALGELALGLVPRMSARGGGSWFWHYEGPRVVFDGAERLEVLGDVIRVRDRWTSLGAEQIRWQHREAGGVTLPAFSRDHLVVGTGRGELIVRERTTGRELRRVPVGSAVASQPVLAGGWAYATTRDGRLLGIPLADVIAPTASYPMWGGNPAHTGTP
jgi:outer membrane protein assembly factor BamB